MKIVVPIQQVFDPKQIRVSSQGRVVTEGASHIIEPASRAALQEALRLKDENGATVDVVALGDASVEESLREAQAMGADMAYLLSDPAFNGGDAGTLAYALSGAVARIGFDILLVGEGGAISGPMLAELLGLPQISAVTGVQVDANGRLVGDQPWAGGVRTVKAKLPALATVADGSSETRYAHAARVMAVFSEPTLTVWSAADLGLDESMLGTQGARTQVRRSAPADARVMGERITGTPSEQAKSLVGKLRARGVI